ncbi:uncharacterized protein LOC121258301 [Juglans microcarpa x Juglans regia]|uniref:uncharacterized protein LOC121258301 n=1 Tax=Juglans microcarpa x Juglans regia TaxID=2249226 RepID=UPI001B7ED799|nr:uncharacterized protein LOC121258301 [Juglans microcarpa x Juglans regia]
MDSLNFYNIKVEKANAMRRHHQLQKIANLCRIIKNVTVNLTSPRFVFFVGNVIVITLFAKSGQFSTRDSTTKTSEFDLYEEFIEKSEKIQRVHSDDTRRLEEHSTYDSKVKDYRRVQSYLQSSNRGFGEKSLPVPHRIETEKLRKSSYSCDRSTKSSNTEDESSHEEFQRRVEAFIARQQRLRREELYSVVL